MHIHWQLKSFIYLAGGLCFILQLWDGSVDDRKFKARVITMLFLILAVVTMN